MGNKYFETVVIAGKSEKELTDLAIKNSNKKDEFLKQFKTVQKSINLGIAKAQEKRLEAAKKKPDTQGIKS